MEREVMSRDEMLAALRETGADEVVVYFEGGYDEGHIGPIHLHKKGEKFDELEVLPYHILVLDDDGKPVREEVEYKGSDGKPVVTKRNKYRDHTDEEKKQRALVDALSEPIYGEYGSFAGDFSVSGRLVWDVNDESALIKGEESFETYEPFEKEV